MSTNCTTAGTVRLGWTMARERVQARVGDLDHADVRLDGAERVVRGLGLRGGQGVEERGFADVGEADNGKAQHSAPGVLTSNVCRWF